MATAATTTAKPLLITQQQTRSLSCDECALGKYKKHNNNNNNNNKSIANGYCTDCQLNLCRICLNHHNKGRATTFHKTIKFRSILNGVFTSVNNNNNNKNNNQNNNQNGDSGYDNDGEEDDGGNDFNVNNNNNNNDDNDGLYMETSRKNKKMSTSQLSSLNNSNKKSSNNKNNSLTPVPTTTTTTFDRCEFHRTQDKKVFCNSCNLFICLLCYRKQHYNHVCSGVNAVVIETKKVLAVDIELIKKCLETARIKIREIETEKISLALQLKMAAAAILKEQEVLAKMAETNSKELLEDLGTLELKLMTSLGAEIDDTNDKVKGLQSMLAEIKDIKSLKMADPVCINRNLEIHESAISYCNDITPYLNKKVNRKHVTFKSTIDWSKVANMRKNILGVIEGIHFIM
ncbi:hypothetical protein HELRODRAFT_179686 [Helobdella robusta]|uniref:B box-type domain-containing protein n=1 Tax=Helobdella robusta TaxID=6412 RepID=T1FF11_HELRO|nr:hypothetical protein HELRODRAFT_179686 [Helobdella robusta]ESN95099.1 hypothetical protein HELRODRAFT_179686 [Helobdella robusta]